MAQKVGLSQTAVVRIWRAFGLQPHRVENFMNWSSDRNTSSSRCCREQSRLQLFRHVGGCFQQYQSRFQHP
jgi:hypothetical protein